ncbi:MAG TPA: tetratricopeptide repeat protein [Desulfobacterales bacterium]|nr:tetratricopeptide repeat protein [Desulfobacterales bacterium]
MGQLDLAQRHLLESLHVLEVMGSSLEVLMTHLSLAKLYREQSMWKEANESNQRALEMAQQLGSVSFETEALFRLAEIHYLAGDYHQCLDWANKASAMAIDYGFHNWSARSLLTMGLAYFQMGLLTRSVDALVSAISYADKFGPTMVIRLAAESKEVLEHLMSKGHRSLAKQLCTSYISCLVRAAKDTQWLDYYTDTILRCEDWEKSVEAEKKADARSHETRENT